MAQRKTLSEQIESIEKELKQRENRLNELLQKKKIQNEKARTHRLCKRAGYLESRLPESVALTDEQFFIFLEKTILTEFARKILNELQIQNKDESVGTEQNANPDVSKNKSNKAKQMG